MIKYASFQNSLGELKIQKYKLKINLAPSSNGLGYLVLIQDIRVRIPVGSHFGALRLLSAS